MALNDPLEEAGLLNAGVRKKQPTRTKLFVFVAFLSLCGMVFVMFGGDHHAAAAPPTPSAHQDEHPHETKTHHSASIKPTTSIKSASETTLSTQSVATSTPEAKPSSDKSPNVVELHPSEHKIREPKTINQKWRITKEKRRPDGVLKSIYLINDAFPGPNIEARPGDHFKIEVENALNDDEGVSLHWHGLAMRGFNEMDGAVGVTQSPIPAGESFTYDFTLDKEQHGTFWYHAHATLQRSDGLYGGLIIHDPKSKENESEETTEQLLMINDWYHQSAEEALDEYNHPGHFGNEPVPDNILINGAGVYNCSKAVVARPIDCEARKASDLAQLKLDRSKRNLLRVVNVGSYAGFNLSMSGSQLTPLEIGGGHKVQGYTAMDVGVLHPGERIDLLIEPSNQWQEDAVKGLTVALDTSQFRYENTALNEIQQFPAEWHGKAKSSRALPTLALDTFDFKELKSTEDQSKILPEKADETIVVYAITQKLTHLDNVPMGFINQTSWVPAAKPLISTPRDEWDKNQFVPHLSFNLDKPKWIDIVLNNLDEESHPFHLHGSSFWVLSSFSSDFNWGSWNPFEGDKGRPDEAPKDDLAGALRTDTFLIPRRGYAVIRLRADNPGVWLMHCHVMWHQASGMAMALDIR